MQTSDFKSLLLDNRFGHVQLQWTPFIYKIKLASMRSSERSTSFTFATHRRLHGVVLLATLRLSASHPPLCASVHLHLESANPLPSKTLNGSGKILRGTELDIRTAKRRLRQQSQLKPKIATDKQWNVWSEHCTSTPTAHTIARENSENHDSNAFRSQLGVKNSSYICEPTNM